MQLQLSVLDSDGASAPAEAATTAATTPRDGERQERLQALQQQVEAWQAAHEDGETERKMLTERCGYLQQQLEGQGIPLEAEAAADHEKAALRARVAALESTLLASVPGHVVHAGNAAQEAENRVLRATLAEYELQWQTGRALQSCPQREADTGGLRSPARGRGAEDVVKYLRSANAECERAKVQAEQLAAQLAQQLAAMTTEKDQIKTRCAALETTLNAANAMVEKVRGVCQKATEHADLHHATQEHWRTASDLVASMREAISIISAGRRAAAATPTRIAITRPPMTPTRVAITRPPLA